MFNSGISVKELIEELNTEVDIALDIPDSTYISWLNSLQHILYREIIKEQKKAVFTPPFENNLIDIASVADASEAKPRFEDVHAVYVKCEPYKDDIQLIKSTVASGVIFENTFFKITDKVAFNTENTPEKVTIVYIVKPALITDENYDDAKVMVPIEFIDLVRAKLRGEAYKLANEDAQSAKWLNDYNILVETFKVWMAEKSPNIGL